MATALREDFDPVARMVTSVGFRSLGDDAPILETWNDPDPVRYIYREIDFKIDGDGFLQFYFLNPALAVDFGPGETIDTVVAGMGPFVPFAPPGMAAAAPSTGPATPLDINLQNTSAYVIYRLRPSRNMFFAPRLAAITHKNMNDQSYCAQLRHVNAAGPSVNGLDDSKLVYLKAKPGADPNNYAHSFNLKVRLLQAPHYGSPWPSVLDIVIDPDIRHPGGSTT